MQRKGFFLLALICGLIAAGSMYFYLHGATRNPSVSLKPLVVVKTNIQARSVIEASQLVVKDVPVQGYPQGGFSSIQNVVGSVALLNLSAGDLVLSAMLQRLNTQTSDTRNPAGGTTALTVPDGKRAVAIPIGLVSGVGYAVKPGDHVDILVTMDIKDSSPNPQVVTATTLAAQDVLVLSVGESITGDKAKVDTKSYTMALSVPQAMAVTYGSEKGSLRLLLRNPANSNIRQDTPVTGNVFLDPNYINRFK
ncbi:Flp pilus assembly protein CpaB [Desulfosporosinus metallidurans]|uniref:Flp pilus assembly protein RcpC/CpaB n=1 Tax=Desulfosporosinus metallidurans TaxID=1888891 RepID=A0A1Q8R227_9FIRM|nr:Flp pilus assembly protein CpaB [Desulfosporosinus metallidurans]OLN33639.1 Flp pilus assembly protein RcpC/CpaB [Desulfosporosinus metallidurans]